MKFRNSAGKCSLGNLMFYQIIERKLFKKKSTEELSFFFLYSVIFSGGISYFDK